MPEEVQNPAVESHSLREQAEVRLRESEELQRRIFEALPANIAVVDHEGQILAVNQAWIDFATKNHASQTLVLAGANYLKVCRRSSDAGDLLAREALAGIEAVLGGAKAQFTQEYPCHGPSEPRWFFMTVVPLDSGGKRGAVISHVNVTERRMAEEELRQRREDLARAQEVGQIGSWRLDTRRNVLSWSTENYRIFGVPRGTRLSYQSFLETIHPEDREYVDERWNAALRGEPYDIEHRIVVGGEVKWLREKAYLEFDPSGELLGGFGISQDITRRKEAEMELRCREEALRAQRERMPIGLVVFDANGLFSQVNPAAERIFGYPESELRGRHANVVVPEHARPHVDDVMRRLAVGDMAAHSVNENLTKDGRIILCEWTNTPLRDAEGTFTGALCMMQDITQRQQADEERQRFVSLVEHSTELIGMCDLELRPFYLNEAGRRLLGLDLQEEACVRELSGYLFPKDYRFLVKQFFPQVLQDGHANAEVPLRHFVTGEPVWVVCHVFQLRNAAGQVTGFAMVGHDISERRRAEEALRQSEERLRIATQAAQMFAWDLDIAAEAVFWSESAAAVIGCRPEELPSGLRQFFFFVAPDDQLRLWRLYEEAVAGRQITFSSEFRGLGDSAKARFFSMHARILYNGEGMVLRVIGVMQDITDRKRVEERVRQTAMELHAANEELRKFNRAMVGREIRMVELKREVNELCALAGVSRRYLLNFEDGKRETLAGSQ